MTKFSRGKLKSLEAVSDKRGVIRAAAMDQRGSLRNSIAKERGVGPSSVKAKDLEIFKTEVTRALTPYASAILLDPEYGLPASKARSKGSGLLLAYELTGYDHTVAGRMPSLIPGYSVKRLKEDGADCVKLLLYYTPHEKKEINEKKHGFIRRVGDECRREDIAFFLEPVGYDTAGGDAKDLAYALKKPDIVARTIEEFSRDEYGVDVLKVEIPVNLQYTEGTRAYEGKGKPFGVAQGKPFDVAQGKPFDVAQGKAYTREEAKGHYRRAAQGAGKPFIYLSAGVSDAEFRESLELAIEAGVGFSGVLCGRATWKDGIPVFAREGPQALRRWLEDQAAKNIQALNKVLEGGARPWFSRYGGREKIQIAHV